MNQHSNSIEKQLWSAADALRANSKLKSSEYAVPVLELIFLRYADQKFAAFEAKLRLADEEPTQSICHANGILFVPPKARFSLLLQEAKKKKIGKVLDAAVRAVEQSNPALKKVLPRNYTALDNSTLAELLSLMDSISVDLEGDAFGRIYEYFLGNFAMSEGQRGGEFFTPSCLVQLIVAIMEPFHGKIFDPACGSAGMFVQCARFVEEHKANPDTEISVFGQEKTGGTVQLAKMNMAIHGLSGDIRVGNTYYEDLHKSSPKGVGGFDFVMANPPFNVDKVDKARLKDDARFPFGLPRTDNANYLWLQIFYSALNEHGRAGFVMANSAADSGHSELAIRRQLIETRAVDVMVAVGPNFFYTVTLACMLWFFDKDKVNTDRADKVLFLDARGIYSRVDRAHRYWTAEQVEYLANIVRLHRGDGPEDLHGGCRLLVEQGFALKESDVNAGVKGQALRTGSGSLYAYRDMPGLCRSVTLAEIEAQGWSLNPARYVGVEDTEENGIDFAERMAELRHHLAKLNRASQRLYKQIDANYHKLLDDK